MKKLAIIGQEILMSRDIYPGGVPNHLKNHYFRYIIDTYINQKQKFCLIYLNQAIKHNGQEWISLPDDSRDRNVQVLNKVSK